MADDGTELRRDLRQRRNVLGISQRELAARVGYGRDYVSKIEAGERLPSEEAVRALDRELGAGGSLVELRGRTWLRRQAERAGVTDAGSGDAVNRREALALGGAAFATEISNRIARADPTPMTVRELAADVQALAADYPVTPYATLAPRVETGWRDVEMLLDSRLSPMVRRRLTLLAGQYAYYAGQIGFATGDDRAAGAYLSLAGQHAAEVDDVPLAGSVAAVDSMLSYFTGDYATAADIAGAARGRADPYIRPKLAACEARAAVRAGRTDDARAALLDMEASVWTGEPQPGPEMVDEEAVHAYAAIVAGYLGDGERAEDHARESLAMLARKPGQYVQGGGTYAALGRAHLRRRRPDPEQAASAASTALDVLGGQPSRTVRQQVNELRRELSSRWPDLPAVRDLGDQVAATEGVTSA